MHQQLGHRQLEHHRTKLTTFFPLSYDEDRFLTDSRLGEICRGKWLRHDGSLELTACGGGHGLYFFDPDDLVMVRGLLLVYGPQLSQEILDKDMDLARRERLIELFRQGFISQAFMRKELGLD